MAGTAQAPRGATGSSGAKRRSFWRELPVLVVVALVLALLIKAFLVQSFRIPSGSMEDTLHIGDWVLVNKVIYDVRGLDRGDIVVFSGQGSWDPPAAPAVSEGFVGRAYHDVLRFTGLESNGTDYIKRVIGLPGDHVMCCDSGGHIVVNGVPLRERSYLYPGSNPSIQQFTIVVPPGRIWVMGDHRADSADSRYHMQGPGDGTVPINRVVGRAFMVFWPPSQLRTLSIPTTFKQAALTRPASLPGPAGVPVLRRGSIGTDPRISSLRWTTSSGHAIPRRRSHGNPKGPEAR
jgi:signal peptidase I